jgi:DNA polymerase-3 subunit beta
LPTTETSKRGCSIEQLNIEGKRSGTGFVAHKAILVNALSRALAERLALFDLTIGRKGLLNYLKSLSGSNIVKIVPDNGNASGSQVTAKRLKVVCGANTSYLEDLAWIKTEGKGKITPLTLAEVRVSPNNAVKPNVGANELAEALNRVLPFTAWGDDRPVLACVNFTAKDGKLTLVSADGFRLAVVSLDYDDGEGQALINRDELRGIANAFKRAKRVRVSFEGEDVTKPSSLILDTELIRYKWANYGGSYPEWQKLIPTEFNCFASFDTVEAVKAVNSLKALSDNPKAYPIDLTIGEGKLVMANPDDKGQAELSADTDGQGFVRVDGKYLAQALKACGGMVDFKMSTPVSPMLFSANGYQLVVMPMITDKAKEYEKAKQAEAKAEPAKPNEPTEPATEKHKRKQKAKEPVAVA